MYRFPYAVRDRLGRCSGTARDSPPDQSTPRLMRRSSHARLADTPQGGQDCGLLCALRHLAPGTRRATSGLRRGGGLTFPFDRETGKARTDLSP
jgi:hypothetical protein